MLSTDSFKQEKPAEEGTAAAAITEEAAVEYSKEAAV
jgi:hypothetical protein